MLADLVRRSALTELEDSTESVARLAELVVRAGRVVVVARLNEINEELAQVVAHCEGMPLVVLLPHAQQDAIQALRAGASAVVEEDADEHQIAAAVVSAYYGLVALPAGSARFAEPPGPLAAQPEPLTVREIEILSLLAGGDSNKTIAARLSISVHTVKFHISSILSKLGVSSRTEAVALGLRLGIVLL